MLRQKLFGSDRFGDWVNLKFDYRLAHSNKDGRIRVWVDDTLVVDKRQSTLKKKADSARLKIGIYHALIGLNRTPEEREPLQYLEYRNMKL